MGFRVHYVHLGHFEICNLHIPNRPFIIAVRIHAGGANLCFQALANFHVRAVYRCRFNIPIYFVQLPKAVMMSAGRGPAASGDGTVGVSGV